MLYLLLAAYNEEKDLETLLNRIDEQHWEFPCRILLINDGSTDGTRTVAERFSARLPMTIINHDRNRGLGATLLTGFSSILAGIKDSDLLVTMDADATHSPELLPGLMEEIALGSDLVIASRFCDGGGQAGVSAVRRTLSSGARIMFSLLWPIQNVRDYTSGYRAYSGKLVNMLAGKYGPAFINDEGFAATLELLLKSSTLTRKITERPLRLEYGRKTGISKMRITRTIFADMRTVFRLRRFLTK